MKAAIECDVLVVGGGINGCGIARDAAGRGLTTVLCEKDDLAAHTSSASTKLIHGGLRYLEQFEFGLVRKALAEREILMRAAPHVIWPLQFVMPHVQGQRPAWVIRAGLMLYDRLAARQVLASSRRIDLSEHAAGGPLKDSYLQGFVYADAWVDDARLVVLNAMDAAERGAQICTRTACTALHRSGNQWQATLDHGDGCLTQVTARSVVNATGPWAGMFLGATAHGRVKHRVRLVKGSHIVVPKLFDHDYAYLFQHPDGRVIFAIPYEKSFTLIGTTDVEHGEDPGRVAISAVETAYLCEAASRYFNRAVVPENVVWSYAGVRPLFEDGAPTQGAGVDSPGRASAANVSRDYALQLDLQGAPMLSIFGGKLTTYRKLAEEALDMLAPQLGERAPAWTQHACLPGGDLFGSVPSNRAVLEFDTWSRGMQARHAQLPAPLLRRYARAYGTRLEVVLAGCVSLSDLGAEIVPGLFAKEAQYLIKHEWARCAQDVLWRRSKLGLHLPASAAQVLDAWIAPRLGERA